MHFLPIWIIHLYNNVINNNINKILLIDAQISCLNHKLPSTLTNYPTLKIMEPGSREKYREYNELINLINSECRNIQSNDVKSIKSGIDIASKILHGKTEVTESDWSKLEICFLKLLKYINKVINSIKD